MNFSHFKFLAITIGSYCNVRKIKNVKSQFGNCGQERPRPRLASQGGGVMCHMSSPCQVMAMFVVREGQSAEVWGGSHVSYHVVRVGPWLPMKALW